MQRVPKRLETRAPCWLTRFVFLYVAAGPPACEQQVATAEVALPGLAHFAPQSVLNLCVHRFGAPAGTEMAPALHAPRTLSAKFRHWNYVSPPLATSSVNFDANGSSFNANRSRFNANGISFNANTKLHRRFQRWLLLASEFQCQRRPRQLLCQWHPPPVAHEFHRRWHKTAAIYQTL